MDTDSTAARWMSGDKSDRRHLPRHLRDPDRASQLIRRFAADDDAAEIAQRAVDDKPGLLHAHPDRLRRRHRLQISDPPAPSTG